MERYSKQNKKSWKADETDIPRFLGHWLKKNLSTITQQEVQFVHEKVKKENGLYQANLLLSRIQVIYNKAIEWGWNVTNPAQGVKEIQGKITRSLSRP
jgi:hypothetical protein